MKANETTLLSARNLSIYFGATGRYLKAVHQAGLRVGPGEIVGLIGESGSGKTTLSLGLLGLIKGLPGLWSGEATLGIHPLVPIESRFVSFHGGRIRKRISAFHRVQRRMLEGLLGRQITTIFQEPKAALDPYYTVGEHMMEALERSGQHPPGNLKQRAVGLLKDVGLIDAEGLLDLYPHEISGGMAQRVMISMALCADPRLLIADEPTTSLDVTTQAKLLELFLRLRESKGLGILIISHDIGVIHEISDRIYVMHRGHIVEAGPTSRLLSFPKHPYTASLLNSFARFGEKQALPPSDPEAGAGCAYRDLCASYAQTLGEDEKIRCETEKPRGQTDMDIREDVWSRCHFPETSKDSREKRWKTDRAVEQKSPALLRSEPQILLEARNVVKSFSNGGRRFLALGGVSLSIERGATYGLVGESGSGKSTLGLSLLALQSVDSGEVLFRGNNIFTMSKSRLRKTRRGMRMLFQQPEAVLNSGMTVRLILEEALEGEDGLTRTERLRRMEEALLQVRLDPIHLNRYPGNLSSGEKQRVTIARALLTRPEFLVCDEPVASLDLAIQSQVLGLLRDFQQDLGLTYLFISHNLSMVKILANRIGVMYMGYLVEEADSEHFEVARVRHPYTRLLLASAPVFESPNLREVLAAYPDVEPVRLMEGCPFRNRCPLYSLNPMSACETENPSLKILSDGSKVACHQIGDLE